MTRGLNKSAKSSIHWQTLVYFNDTSGSTEGKESLMTS
jgi:hypothetical protein